MVRLYFLLVQIAAWLGHHKAKLLIQGQASALAQIKAWRETVRGNVLWVHVSSVGEFEQARPLIEYIRSYHDCYLHSYKIVLTFFSPSGYELRSNYNLANLVTYLPMPTRANAKKLIAALEPKMAIWVKYEFWPAYLHELKRCNIPVYIIAAIFRPRQLFFRPWGGLYRSLLKCFTHLFVQDEASAQLLLKHGIKQVTVAGDTRFDRVMRIAGEAKPVEEIQRFVDSRMFQDPLCPIHYRVLVAGSTWPKDERLLARFMTEHEDVRLVLVPHEITEDHMQTIFQLFQGRCVRFTQATQQNIGTCRVLVLDTLGILASVYQYADAAYIGGGFGKGIHNTIEAAVYGIPVVFGPKYQHFREAIGLIHAGAACSVHNYRELDKGLTVAFDQHAEQGALARQYVESELGATDKIMKKIINY